MSILAIIAMYVNTFVTYDVTIIKIKDKKIIKRTDIARILYF